MNKNKYILCGLLLFAAWFFNIGHTKLLEPDEGRYAEISREMALSNDFVTPRLNGIKYFEKPPLQYWATALTYKVFGESEWTSRLWPALTGFLCILVMFLFALSEWGPLRAELAALILASSPLFIIMGHINNLDMGLTFFLTLSMIAILKLLRHDLPEKSKKNFSLLLWAAAAFGFLSKGLVALVLPGMVLFLYLIITRDFVFLKNLKSRSGHHIFAAIVAPWLIFGELLRNPEFLKFFFIHEHFDRFLTKSHDRPGPIWYFAPILLAGFSPWLFTFLNFRKLKLNQETQNKNSRLFLILWAVAIFGFFSISSSKLPHYILPVIPALALLCAELIESLKERSERLILISLGFFTFISLFATIRLQNFESKYTPPELLKNLSTTTGLTSLLLILGLILYFILRKRLDWSAKVKWLAISSLMFFQILLWGYEALSPAHSGYTAAQAIRPYLENKIPVFIYQNYVQSLPFYLKTPITLVDFRGELEFGLKQELVNYIPTEDRFAAEWKHLDKAILVLSKPDYNKLTTQGLTMSIAFEDRRRIVAVKGFSPDEIEKNKLEINNPAQEK